jgi:uncharacterized protein (DUF58 family)
VVSAPDRLLLQLEWRVIRRLDGRVQGAYRTAYRGSGLDFAGLRGYVEEDDARHIDWNATARMNEPQVRLFTEDRDLTVWLVLDRSASMTVGTPGRDKQDVLSELALVLARLFSRGGNRVGALLYGGAATRVVPTGTGRGHALRIGYELDRTAGLPSPAGTTDFAAMLDAVSLLARRRSLIIVISDFIGTGEWDKPLLRLSQRHDVAALRVVDAADDDLPDAGLIFIEDAETGEQFLVDSSDPLFRARLQDGVDERDADLTGRMRRAGVPLHRISTDRDPLEALVDVIASTWWRRA